MDFAGRPDNEGEVGSGVREGVGWSLGGFRKKLAKPPGSTVQSMAEALKPEHGLETLAILKSWAASAVCFSGGDGIRL